MDSDASFMSSMGAEIFPNRSLYFSDHSAESSQAFIDIAGCATSGKIEHTCRLYVDSRRKSIAYRMKIYWFLGCEDALVRLMIL